jgi:uncharacterized repeat protein (TIGR03803 family)
MAEQLENRCLPSVTTFASLVDTGGGAHPNTALIQDASGNLYGTTSAGGAFADGTVFELQPASGIVTVLASFNGTNGSNPEGDLVEDSNGNLFGTTESGGIGSGTLYELPRGSGTIKVIASFASTLGQQPMGHLVEDSSGNFFGTTFSGGSSNEGSVFEVSSDTGTITTLATFSGSNGAYPEGGIIEDSSGNLFGTTEYGGNGYAGGNTGSGTVFEVAHGTRTLSTLASLSSVGPDASPEGLMEDGSGNFFGITQANGTYGYGSVYELQHGSSKVTVLASFSGGSSSGATPYGSLIQDNAGNLYGATEYGGPTNDGTVFELQQGSSTITMLAALNKTSGSNPDAGLFRDSGGNLFGTALNGGPSNHGSVFEVANNSGKITTLAPFLGVMGASPLGGLVQDSSGNLIGTASSGGPSGYGDIFEVQPGSGRITVLAGFNFSNGVYPYGSLMEDGSGNLFGTMEAGGSAVGSKGTIFELPRGSGTVTTLANFNGTNGAQPYDSLIEDSSGNLFGTTFAGGASNDGTVFELPSGSGTIITLANFNGTNGANPYAGVIEDISGNLYGTTYAGGANNLGTIFEVQNGSGRITTLVSFNRSNGANPYGGLIADSSGNLFGACDGGPLGFGLVFELKKGSGTITPLASFQGTIANPHGSIIQDSSGNIFGTTSWMSFIQSSVFELPKGHSAIITLGTYLSATGMYQLYPTLVEDSSGNLYGTTGPLSGNNGTVFEVSTRPTITTASLPDGVAGTAYSQTISTSGGAGAITFSTSAGSLPAGLTLSTRGVLSGTPTIAGSYSFTVTATDQAGTSASQNYTLSVSPGPFHAYQVTIQGPSSVSAGSGVLNVVQATDAYGNPVFNYSGPTTVTATLNPASPGSGFPATVAMNGFGMGFVVANLQAVGSYTISVADSSGTFTGTSSAVTITPAAAARLAFATQPANTPTGVSLLPVTVEVEDQFGNLVTSDNTDTVTLGIASGPGGLAAGSTITAAVVNGVATLNNLTLIVPGNYTLSAIVPNAYTGPFSNTFTVEPLQIKSGSFASSPTGFSVSFNAPFLVNSMNPVLYGTGFGKSGLAPTVTLTLATATATTPASLTVPYVVPGTVALNTATNSLTFIETDTWSSANNGTPILPDGIYTAVIHGTAAGDGLQAFNSGGGYLDGTNSGTPGHDFTATFTVGAAAVNEDVVWVPATANGPLQNLSAPGNNKQTLFSGGYPVYLDDSTGTVGSVTGTFNYNPTIVTVTGGTSNGALPGSIFSVHVTTPGTATFTYTDAAGNPNAGKLTGGVGSGNALVPFGSISAPTLGFITAAVPNSSAATPIYKAKDLLTLSNIQINASSATPVIGAGAVHLVAYVGDADGNGSYSSGDAVLITRTLVAADTGFAVYPLVDPTIVADTDGSGFIPADAALQVNEIGVGLPAMNCPDPGLIPGVNTTPIGNNVDPQLSVVSYQLPVASSLLSDNRQLATDNWVSVNINDAHPDGSTGLIRGHLALTYDPNVFTVSAADVHAGSLLNGGGWSIVPSIDETTGQIVIALSSDTPIASVVGGSLVSIDFHQRSGEPGALATGGVAPPVADGPGSPHWIAIAPLGTELEDTQGAFTLTLPPAASSISLLIGSRAQAFPAQDALNPMTTGAVVLHGDSASQGATFSPAELEANTLPETLPGAAIVEPVANSGVAASLPPVALVFPFVYTAGLPAASLPLRAGATSGWQDWMDHVFQSWGQARFLDVLRQQPAPQLAGPVLVWQDVQEDAWLASLAAAGADEWLLRAVDP